MKYFFMVIGALLLGYVTLVNGFLYYEYSAGPLAELLGVTEGAEVADKAAFAKEQITCLLVGLTFGGVGYSAVLRDSEV
jgi:hypothetical protein